MNVGSARPILGAGKSGFTGIFKRPTSGPVAVALLGLAGDVISDRANHGGPDRAVYVFGTPDYGWWAESLACDLLPGTFGENLTVAGLESQSLNVGDSLHVGPVVLQVTAPRIPCATLAVRMEDPAFLKRFREAERPGVYCRVLVEGAVERGNRVSVERYGGATISVLEMFRAFFDPKVSEREVRRHLAAPIAERARTHRARQLRRLLAGDR